MRKVAGFVAVCAVALAGVGVGALTPAEGGKGKPPKPPKIKVPKVTPGKKNNNKKKFTPPANYPNLVQAMTLLGQATAKAQMNPWVFGGHRAKAVRHMQVASGELQKALVHVKTHPPHHPRAAGSAGKAPNLSLPPGD